MSKTYNVLNSIENVLLGTGLCVSMVDIQNILSIVLLTFEVIIIAVKVTLKVIDRIKHGDIDGAVSEVEKAQEEIKDIKKRK